MSELKELKLTLAITLNPEDRKLLEEGIEELKRYNSFVFPIGIDDAPVETDELAEAD